MTAKQNERKINGAFLLGCQTIFGVIWQPMVFVQPRMTLRTITLALLYNKGNRHGGDTTDQNSPKSSSTGNIWNLAYWISYNLLCWDIYHTHLSYEQVWQMQLKMVYWRILYMKCAFAPKWVIPKYCLCYLNELIFNSNLFSFIELLTIFCAVFISYLMVIYKSKYPNTIWWIMPCIMSELWKRQIAINL